MKIRFLEPRDTHTLVEFGRTQKELSPLGQEIPFSYDDAFSYITSLLSREEGFSLVVERDNELVGAICIDLCGASWNHQPLCAVESMLYVVPASRGSSVGRTLLDVAITVARDLGAKTFQVGGALNNVGIQRLAERLEFQPTAISYTKSL